jgi:conjugative transfer signal peptidase TraF
MIDIDPVIEQSRKMRLATLCVIAITSILAADLSHQPFLIWNATDSVPVGLYRLSKVAAVHGDIVAVRLPRSIADFASVRLYLPSNVLLLKPLSATAGDQVCRRGSLVFINGALRAIASIADSRGQRLPMWQGCIMLGPDEAIVIGAHRHSYDSRYFGPITTCAIVGRAVPIWIYQE